MIISYKNSNRFLLGGTFKFSSHIQQQALKDKYVLVIQDLIIVRTSKRRIKYIIFSGSARGYNKVGITNNANKIKMAENTFMSTSTFNIVTHEKQSDGQDFVTPLCTVSFIHLVQKTFLILYIIFGQLIIKTIKALHESIVTFNSLVKNCNYLSIVVQHYYLLQDNQNKFVKT